MLDRTTTARTRVRPTLPVAVSDPAPSSPSAAQKPYKSPHEYPVMTYKNMVELNKRTRPLVEAFRVNHMQWRERVLIHELRPSEFVLMTAIVGRTFSWNRLLESISLSQFVDGNRTKLGEYSETGGLPLFKGTGLDRKTVIKGLQSLHEQGLIERFSFPLLGRDTCAWSPMSAATVLRLIDSFDDMFLPLWAVKRDIGDDGSFLMRPLELDFKARFTGPCLPDDPSDDPSENFER